MSRVAKRYAKALFELAKEGGALAETENDLQMIDQLISGNHELNNLLANPLVKENEKLNTLQGLISGRISELTMNLISLLAAKKRLSILDGVVNQFASFVLEFGNKIKGELISAEKLEEKQVNEIRKNVQEMTGKEVILVERLDSTLIGGFLVRVEDVIIDNSIRYQLTKLHDKFVTR